MKSVLAPLAYEAGLGGGPERADEGKKPSDNNSLSGSFLVLESGSGKQAYSNWQRLSTPKRKKLLFNDIQRVKERVTFPFLALYLTKCILSKEMYKHILKTLWAQSYPTFHC